MSSSQSSPTKRQPDVRIGFHPYLPDATIPVKSTEHAAAFDVHAYCREEIHADSILYTSTKDDARMGWIPGAQENSFSCLTQINVAPGQRAVVPTGLNIRLPIGWELQVRPRSGLAVKNGVTVLNAPGTVDPDFSGDGPEKELKVIVINHGTRELTITHGMRIAQLKAERIYDVELYVDNQPFDDSSFDRQGGFGSTGTAR